MLKRDDARRITERALSFAATPECTVYLNSSETSSIRFALNGITTSGYNIAQSLLIYATKDSRTGIVSANEFDDASLKTAMQSAAKLAETSIPDPEYVEPPGPQKYADAENF